MKTIPTPSAVTAAASLLEDGRAFLPSPDAVQRELVARIVLSPSFARSERLSSMLVYVCDLKLQGREREINEQKIGQAVFGRAKDYDSAADGIVRTQASRLRRRLDLYFEREGLDEPLRLAIPRGRYVPVFEDRGIVSPPSGTIPMPEIVPQAAASIIQPAPARASLRAVPWSLSFVLAVAMLILLLTGSRHLPWDPDLHQPLHPLWSRMFLPDHSTTLVPGDSGLVLFGGLARHNTDLAEYLRGDYRKAVDLSPMRTLEGDLASRRYTSIVDLEVATSLTQLATANRSRLEVRYARDVRPNDLKVGNVILVGASEANPWVELFERNMNFALQNNLDTHVFSVVNRSPQANEPPRWESAPNDPQGRVYGVVAFVPNLASNGNALILEGTSMSGTEAAWDFVHDDNQLLPFLNRIQRPDGALPYFELLLGSNNVGASAVRCTLLAWRTGG